MKVHTEAVPAEGLKFIAAVNGNVIGRAHLYVMRNDLHVAPFGLLEDVFVDDAHRKDGLGTALVKRVIAEAKRRGCYKLVATSRMERPHVHAWYLKLGFHDCGKEFRLDF